MQSIGVPLKNGGQGPPMATFSHKGRREEDEARGRYADLASAPSIMATEFCNPYTATNEPKRGPFS